MIKTFWNHNISVCLNVLVFLCCIWYTSTVCVQSVHVFVLDSNVSGMKMGNFHYFGIWISYEWSLTTFKFGSLDEISSKIWIQMENHRSKKRNIANIISHQLLWIYIAFKWFPIRIQIFKFSWTCRSVSLVWKL